MASRRSRSGDVMFCHVLSLGVVGRETVVAAMYVLRTLSSYGEGAALIMFQMFKKVR